MCCQRQARGVCFLPLIEVLEGPPDLLHIRPGGVGRPCGRMPIPPFHCGVRSAGVYPSRGRLQTHPALCCCLLCSFPGVRHEGPTDRSGDPPHHVAAVVRVPSHGRTLINQPNGVWGHPEGERGAFQLGGDRFQGIEGLKLFASSAKFRGGEESERECSPSSEVPGVATGWAS